MKILEATTLARSQGMLPGRLILLQDENNTYCTALEVQVDGAAIIKNVKPATDYRQAVNHYFSRGGKRQKVRR